MVVLNKIYTRGGDQGKTSLGDGTRVAKHNLRVEAYGTVDETNAVIGMARLHTTSSVDDMLARIQNDLFDLGADLCRPEQESQETLRVLPAQVERLEQEIDDMNKELAPLTSFILPGGQPAAAHLHHARTVCRRGERLCVALAVQETINKFAIQYLNRLSDHLFVASRFLNEKGAKDVLWVPGKNR